jgi:hypothetical protein
MPDNDLVLDMESVTVNGERYALRTDATRIDSGRDNSLVGSIVGAISGGEVRGRTIRLPRNSLLTFRIQRPMDMGVADRGVDRDGRHYHIGTAIDTVREVFSDRADLKQDPP